ncbi:hypothetical protein Daus18300_005498 [Diaporthe australafricana]|uniref:Uncharacterized protein n=1 Tax=Diaporthe australafricana TaxID=127596 RepID=A0ABR3X0Z5_9PEZI
MSDHKQTPPPASASTRPTSPPPPPQQQQQQPAKAWTGQSLRTLPGSEANRSIYRGNINLQIEKTEVEKLLVELGIAMASFTLYWDTRSPPNCRHRGYCWVELTNREDAYKPQASRPSTEELDAARNPQPVERPDEPETDSDQRKARYVEACKKLFPIAYMMDQNQGIDITPGFGEENASHSRSYTPPDNIGPSWIQWNEFAAWRASGRSVDSFEVKELNWHDPGPLVFVTSSGEKVLELPIRPDDDPNKLQAGHRPMSLWRKMAEGSGKMTDALRQKLDEKEMSLPLPRDMGL